MVSIAVPVSTISNKEEQKRSTRMQCSVGTPIVFFSLPVTHFLILMAAIDGENVLAKNGIFEGTSGLL